jgi:hypothetical protein
MQRVGPLKHKTYTPDRDRQRGRIDESSAGQFPGNSGIRII